MLSRLDKILPRISIEIGRKSANPRDRLESLRATFRRHRPPIFINEFVGSGGFSDVFTATSDDGSSKPLALPATVRVVAWEKPRADFIGPSEATEGEPVSFVDTTAGRVDRRRWCW